MNYLLLMIWPLFEDMFLKFHQLLKSFINKLKLTYFISLIDYLT